MCAICLPPVFWLFNTIDAWVETRYGNDTRKKVNKFILVISILVFVLSLTGLVYSIYSDTMFNLYNNVHLI